MFPKSFQQARQAPALSVQVITSTGQWVCPAGVYRAKLTLTGAGANSGTSTGGYGVGGSAAGTAIKWLDVVPGATYSIVIGAIAALASSGTNTAPAAGGSSSFSGPNISTITANGGGVSAGGTASGGDLNIAGGSAPLGGVSGGLGIYLGGASYLSGNANAAAMNFGAGGASPAIGAAANAGYQGVAILEF